MTTYTAVEVENLVRAARDDARKAGVAQERARVLRCRNAAFRGVRMAASQLEALGTLDGMLLRGEDPGGPTPTLPDFDLTVTARDEVAERDAQIARLAVESDATEAALRAQVEAAEQRVQDFRDAAHDLLLDAEGSAVEGHSEVQTRLLDVLQGLADS